MTKEHLKLANEITEQIDTLKGEIRTLSNMEHNTREKKSGTHRLAIRKLFNKPSQKTVYNYWSSQNLDSIYSIVLFDPDEIQVLIDFKQAKIEQLQRELEEL